MGAVKKIWGKFITMEDIMPVVVHSGAVRPIRRR